MTFLPLTLQPVNNKHMKAKRTFFLKDSPPSQIVITPKPMLQKFLCLNWTKQLKLNMVYNIISYIE